MAALAEDASVGEGASSGACVTRIDVALLLGLPRFKRRAGEGRAWGAGALVVGCIKIGWLVAVGLEKAG